MVTHTFNPGTGKAAGRSPGIEGQHGPQSESPCEGTEVETALSWSFSLRD